MNLEEIKEKAIPVCKHFNVKRLDIFGSIARGEKSKTSDIDLVVEFEEPNQKPSKRFFGLLHHFEDVFQSSVDLVTFDGVRNPYFKERILKERINIYGG